MSSATERPPGMPTWVKVSLAILLVLVAVGIVVAVVAPGGHGPRMHG